MDACTKIYWVNHLASQTLAICVGLIAGTAWENPSYLIVISVMMAASIIKFWTSLSWVNHLASRILAFCVGFIAGTAWENPSYLIIAFVMMAACIIKIWASESAKKLQVINTNSKQIKNHK